MIPLFFRRFLHPPPMMRAAVLLVAVLAYGSTGYVYFELPAKPELGFSDGLWWAIVTLTTVGYGDYFPASPGGRFLVALPLMLSGIGLLGYVLSVAAASLVDNKNKELKGMATFAFKDHLVIVNFPGLGKVSRVIHELRHDGALGDDLVVVLIDEDLEELPVELQDLHVHYVRGNPARDATLVRAAVDQAAQAVVLSKRPGDPRSDDQVLAITLAIEARSRAVSTVVECVDPDTEELLRKAGCDHVVCSARFDASFLASEARAPGTQDIVDDLLHTGGQQLFITPVVAGTKDFRALASACQARGHLAIGVRRSHGSQLNLAPDFVVQSDDRVITIGLSRLIF